jgi:hypothetical protein
MTHHRSGLASDTRDHVKIPAIAALGDRFGRPSSATRHAFGGLLEMSVSSDCHLVLQK